MLGLGEVKNFAIGTVLTPPSPTTTGTSVVLNSGQGALFPVLTTGQYFKAVVCPANARPVSTNAEIWKVTARSTDTLTIERGAESSTARDVQVGDIVFLMAGSEEEQEGVLTVLETGWNDEPHTWTFSSIDDPTGIVTVDADVTDIISEGAKIKITNGGNTIYGFVSKAPVYSSPNTTITFLHEIDPTDSQALHLLANSAITSPQYSHVHSPVGFPLDPDKWSVENILVANAEQSNPVTGTVYNPSSTSITVPIGSWYLDFAGLWMASNGFGNDYITLEGGLSTSASSFSEAQLQCYNAVYTDNDAVKRIEITFAKGDVVNLTAKDIYYLLIASVFDFDVHTLRIGINTRMTARCAYL